MFNTTSAITLATSLENTRENTKVKYPIYFAEVTGRIMAQPKITKAGRMSKPKEIFFKEKIVLKCHPGTHNPVHIRSYHLSTKFGSLKDKNVVYDKIVILNPESKNYSYVKD